MQQAHLKVIPDQFGNTAEANAVKTLMGPAAVCQRHDGSTPKADGAGATA